MTAFWLHNFTANPKIILEDETIIDQRGYEKVSDPFWM